eukprot:7376606-Prymnesium_polylepis.1
MLHSRVARGGNVETRGCVTEFDTSSGRYTVKLRGGDVVYARPDELSQLPVEECGGDGLDADYSAADHDAERRRLGGGGALMPRE